MKLKSKEVNCTKSYRGANQKLMRQALAVAAKAPQVGKVKTRLHPILTAQDALELYLCFLRDTVDLMESVPSTDLFISYTPEGSEPLFEDVAKNGHSLLVQRGLGFGEKLFNALDDLLEKGY